MKTQDPIALLMLPLVAGTAAGVFPRLAPEALRSLASAALLLVATILAVLLSRQRKHLNTNILPQLLLFHCGFLCACTEALCGGAATPGFLAEAARTAAEGFRAGIDAIPFPHSETAPLVKALLSGDRSGLTRETVATFRASGASHLLALSGLHAGILYLILSRALSVLGNRPSIKYFRSISIILAAGFYTLMTGNSPSMVRAFLFISIRESARLAGRDPAPMGVLALALTIQLTLHPSVLRSVGFQLSYSAMLGIFLLYPPLAAAWPEPAEPRDPVFRRNPLRLIWDSAALSIACQAFTAPIAWLYFRSFPKYFLLTNLLAIPLTTALVPAALLTLAVHTAMPSTTAEGILAGLTDRLAGLLKAVLEIISTM